VGRAIIHLGSHRHGAANVTRGFRQNLIVWGRAAAPPADGRYASNGPTRLHPREHAPDSRCLSWTHDADYDAYQPLPEAALRRRRARAEQAELMGLVRRVTDVQISRLPDNFQPLVRMLKAADASRTQPD